VTSDYWYLSDYGVVLSFPVLLVPCHCGQEYALGGQSCTTCSEASYSLADRDDTYYISDSDKTSCKACPSNAYCAGGANISVSSGYWRWDADSSKVYACPYSSNCDGGENGGDGSCEEGAQGPLCAVCSNGYYFSEAYYRQVS
jgi:hypothetical protein